MRPDHQSLQREDLPVRLVLVRRAGADQLRQLLHVAVPGALLARAGPVCPQAAARLRLDAARAGHPGQIHRELSATGRHVHRPSDRHEHGRGGGRGGAVRTVEQLQPGASTLSREAGPQVARRVRPAERRSTNGDRLTLRCVIQWRRLVNAKTTYVAGVVNTSK